MSDKCREPGCGAHETIGKPCRDLDCPQQFVPAEAYASLSQEVENLQKEVIRLATGRGDALAAKARQLLDKAHRACFEHPDRGPISMSHGPFSGVNEVLGIVAQMKEANARLTAQLNELRCAVMGTEPPPGMRHGQFVEMARTLHGAADGERARAEAAEAEATRLRTALIEAGRAVGAFLHDDVSNDFLMGVPREAALVTARLTAERDAALERVRSLEAEATAEIGPEIAELCTQLELSGISGELIDAVASAIRADGSDVCDGAWASVPETSKIGWRGDAIRAIAALVYFRPGIKDSLTPDFACPALSHKEGR